MVYKFDIPEHIISKEDEKYKVYTYFNKNKQLAELFMFAVKLSPFSLTEITDEFCSRMKYVLSNKVIQARLISLKRLSLLDSKKIVEVHMDESKLNSKILSKFKLETSTLPQHLTKNYMGKNYFFVMGLAEDDSFLKHIHEEILKWNK